jgi:hypothetical protein
MGKENLEFDKFSVIIDSENLRFDEASISNYIQTEGSFYDNFGYYLALAERNLQNKESIYEKTYCERFVEAKEAGSSDKLAEAKAKSDADVVDLKDDIFTAKYAVNRLKNHLKAWDKNHDNAQSLGHTLRRQMDRLSTDSIHGNHGYQGYSIDRDISSIVGSFEPPVVEDNGFDSAIGIEGLV